MPDGTGNEQEENAHPHQHDHGDEPELHEIGIEAFGVGFVVAAPEEAVPHVRGILPPGWQEKEPAGDHEHFYLRPQEDSEFRVLQGTHPAGSDPDDIKITASASGSHDLGIALEVLDSKLRAHIALQAPDHIFVHAGAVGYGGRAIVIPGAAFSGKTTLVTELVRAGATYYSDEYAVLDGAGLVHPYPKPLSIRLVGLSQVDHAVEAIGGVAGVEPLPVGLLVLASYSPEAQWDPARLSSGEAVLAVLENTIPAQDRPEQAMSAITKAVNGAVALKGERPDAPAIAPDLLATLQDQARASG